MSYRLIDANAIASQRPEVNDMPCIYADLDKGLDGRHYDLRGADTLQAENAELREQGARLFDKTLELGTENAKLRELVQDIYGVMWAVSERCWYEDRMRELGIEVE